MKRLVAKVPLCTRLARREFRGVALVLWIAALLVTREARAQAAAAEEAVVPAGGGGAQDVAGNASTGVTPDSGAEGEDTGLPVENPLLEEGQARREARSLLHLSLHDAVRGALERNFDVRLARIDRDVRDREIIVEQAIFDPFFTLGYTFSKNRSPTASFLDIGGGALRAAVQVNPFETRNFFGSIGGRTILGTTYDLRFDGNSFDRPLASGLFGINPQESTAASLSVTQPLVRGAWYRFNAARLLIARNNLEISTVDLELASSDLIYRVEEAYWQLVFTSQNYEVRRNALAVTLESLGNARRKLDAGLLARADVTLVENQLALRRIEVNDAENLLEDARDALLNLMNHGGDRLRGRWETERDVGTYDDLRVVPTTEPDASPFLPDRDGSIAEAFEARADYRALALRLENQGLEVEIASNQLLPRLDVTGRWNQQGLDNSLENSLDSLGSGQFYSWSVGVELEVPLSLRGPRATLHRAEDLLARARIEQAALENSIILAVDQSLRRLEALRRKILYTEEQVRLQQLLYEDELEKLEVGRSIPYTVAEIRNDLITQQGVALQAKTDYMTSKAAYYQAVGGLLERHGVRAPRER